MDNSKIKSRIQALLNKNTENGATEAEAIAALGKAQELMKLYYISMDDLREYVAVEECELRTIEKYKTAYNIDYFLNPLTQLFDCEYFFTKYHVSFFGFKNDLDLVVYFYHLITRSAFSEAKKFKKTDNYKIYVRHRSGRSLISSFVKGFILRIAERMEQMYVNRKSDIPYEQSLVLVNKSDKVSSNFNEKYGGTIKSKRSKHASVISEAFKEGEKRGESMQIHRAIKNAAPAGQKQLKF